MVCLRLRWRRVSWGIMINNLHHRCLHTGLLQSLKACRLLSHWGLRQFRQFVNCQSNHWSQIFGVTRLNVCWVYCCILLWVFNCAHHWTRWWVWLSGHVLGWLASVLCILPWFWQSVTPSHCYIVLPGNFGYAIETATMSLRDFRKPASQLLNMRILTRLVIFAVWSFLRPFFKLGHSNLVQLEHSTHWLT